MISQSIINKKKEIFAAALNLFVDYGFHGTPTSKIAQEAGIANGTLFHYFKTKDALIVALYVDIKTRLGECIEIKKERDESIKARCKRNYVQALYWALENKSEFRFIQQFLSSPYLLLLAPEEIQKQSRAGLEMIKQGIKEKVIKPMPVDLINMLVTSHLFGINQYLINSKLLANQQKKLINQSFELIWDMIT